MEDQAPRWSAYDTVAPDDLTTLLDPPRYTGRSSAFDEIVAAAESHYWNPDDPRYIEFAGDFDLREQLLLPPVFTPELETAVAARIPADRRIEFGNEIARFHLSQLLHGEQGGVALCANLCGAFRDPGAQEYAANQVREETRHVRALSRYIGRRWGAPVGAGGRITTLMAGLISTPEVHQKIVGMQIMIEGLALGTFSAMQRATADPVLKRLLRLIMTDEAYHHRFGKQWGIETIPTLDEAARQRVENWAAGCFLTVAQNLVGAEQKQEIYARYGLDWQWVRGAMAEALAGAARRDLTASNGVFTVLVKTLVQTGIVSSRTRPLYSTWFDLGQLADSPDDSDNIADSVTAELRDINSTRRR
jgi:hypothetical protein